MQSGISNIRYKCYLESFPKAALLSFLTCEGFHTNPSYIESPEAKNSIINTYQRLIALNIPATWHIASNQKADKDTVSLELWLFWFDNKHTNVIEKDIQLKQLQGKVDIAMTYKFRGSMLHIFQKQKVDPSTGIK